MKRVTTTIIILLATICQLSAQNLIGLVTDENEQPMEFATVSLRSLPDSAIVAVCITDTKGQFCIERKNGGDFIQISSIGYSTKNLPVSSFSTSQTIKMQVEAGLLNEIVVSKTRPKTKLLGDAVVKGERRLRAPQPHVGRHQVDRRSKQSRCRIWWRGEMCSAHTHHKATGRRLQLCTYEPGSAIHLQQP